MFSLSAVLKSIHIFSDSCFFCSISLLLMLFFSILYVESLSIISQPWEISKPKFSKIFKTNALFVILIKILWTPILMDSINMSKEITISGIILVIFYLLNIKIKQNSQELNLISKNKLTLYIIHYVNYMHKYHL